MVRGGRGPGTLGGTGAGRPAGHRRTHRLRRGRPDTGPARRAPPPGPGATPPVPLRHAPSAVVLHAGTDRTWPELAHHTLSFGAAWEHTFDELTRTGRLMSDPSLLITRPTTHDPSLAPPGRHLHYVLAPCPNTTTGPSAGTWRGGLGERYRDSLLAVLERRGLHGFASSLDRELLVTPADWTAQGHAAGTPFSVSHTFAQTGPFRPRNLVRGYDNVVLAGCGTTPGVGVPTVLLSGKLAAARITGLARTTAARRRPPVLEGQSR